MKKSAIAILVSGALILGTLFNWAEIGAGRSGFAEAGEITRDIKLFNGPPQGGWRPMAVMIQQNMQKEIPGLRVNIEPGGGASNVIAGNDQQVLAMGATSSIYDGYLGNAPYKKKMENIRQVMVLWSMYHHIVTLAKRGINSIEDMRGKRVNVQQRGFASELVNQMVLSEYNLTYKDIVPQFLGQNDAVDALKDGHIDANMWVEVIPDAVMVDLMSVRDLKVLVMSDKVIQNLAKRNKGLIPGRIPAGTYPGIKEDLPSLDLPTTLLANKDLSEDLVYEITKALVKTFPERQKAFEFLKKKRPEDMAVNVGIPFHPGAVKYYKELGWIK